MKTIFGLLLISVLGSQLPCSYAATARELPASAIPTVARFDADLLGHIAALGPLNTPQALAALTPQGIGVTLTQRLSSVDATDSQKLAGAVLIQSIKNGSVPSEVRGILGTNTAGLLDKIAAQISHADGGQAAFARSVGGLANIDDLVAASNKLFYGQDARSGEPSTPVVVEKASARSTPRLGLGAHLAKFIGIDVEGRRAQRELAAQAAGATPPTVYSRPSQRWPLEMDYVSSLAESPDATKVFVGGGQEGTAGRSGRAVIVAGSSGRILQVFPFTGMSIASSRFSTDGGNIDFIEATNQERIHDRGGIFHRAGAVDAREQKVYARVRNFAESAVDPSNKLLAVSQHYRSQAGIQVYDIASGNLIRELPGLFAAILEFSPDGRSLAAYGEGKVRVFDAVSWNLIHEIAVDQARGPLRWKGDGKTLFAAVKNGVLALDAASGTQLRRYWTGVKNLAVFDVSPDGRRLFFSADGAAVQMLDTESGIVTAVFASRSDADTHSQQRHLRVSRDGKRLYASDWRGLNVWDIP